MTKKYFICDIDNCFADDAHRIPLIDWHLRGDERYDRYNAKMGLDLPVHVGIYTGFAAIATPLFLTGRPQKWESETRGWLGLALGASERSFMLMRPNNTKGLPPAELKKQMLEHLLRGPVDLPDFSIENIIVAFDDVPAVIAMYRSFGIPAIQLQAHPPEDAYEPEDLLPAGQGVVHHQV
jgi:hypothetical protein